MGGEEERYWFLSTHTQHLALSGWTVATQAPLPEEASFVITKGGREFSHSLLPLFSGYFDRKR
jgi:hypothetical protein